MFNSKSFIAATMCAIVAVSIHAQTQLTTGAGPGSVTFTVDGWGMFGGCPSNQTDHSDALYKNTASVGPVVTTCYSAVLLEDLTGCAAPGRTLLALADSLYGQFPAQSTNPAVNVLIPGRHIQTQAPQNVCGLMISVDQRLDGPDPGGSGAEGSSLVQTYTITNGGATPRSFKLIRFMDSDLSQAFSSNRGGASRRLADCGGNAPYVSNKEWVFEFDGVNTPGVVVALGAEGVDDTGQPIQTAAYRVHASPIGHPNPTFVSNPSAFLTDTIDNDADGDLLSIAPELTGDYAMFQGLTYTVAPGATVYAYFRTRWTSLDPGSITPLETQARDIGCRTWGGNYSGQGSGPMLCVNGQGQCASVAPGAPFTISLAAAAAGPNPTDYLVFATFGQPIAGTVCGSPQASDFALWGPPIGLLGFGVFPVSSSFATWSGGGGTLGIPLISSLAGVALVQSTQAGGTIPGCGGTPIVAVSGLALSLSVTLQAAVADASTGPLPVTLSNAVTLSIGCPCQTH
jgi:hypothetical protein